VQQCFFILNKYKLLAAVHCNTATAVLLQGCETWSLTLRGEHTLRVFENGVRKVFGCNRRLEKTAQRGASGFVLLAKHYDDQMGGR